MIQLSVNHTFVVRNGANVSLAIIDLSESTQADASATVSGNITTIEVRRTTSDFDEIRVLMGVIREFNKNLVTRG